MYNEYALQQLGLCIVAHELPIFWDFKFPLIEIFQYPFDIPLTSKQIYIKLHKNKLFITESILKTI
jgi:hypothetical protein